METRKKLGTEEGKAVGRRKGSTSLRAGDINNQRARKEKVLPHLLYVSPLEIEGPRSTAEEEGTVSKPNYSFSSSGEEASPPASSPSSSIKRWKAFAIRRRLCLRPLEGPADREPALLKVASEGSSPGLLSPQNGLTHQRYSWCTHKKIKIIFSENKKKEEWRTYKRERVAGVIFAKTPKQE
ncbi:UNVERIFIED_CONTAM: hypothetical protein Slati_3921400 [Sesamum latifolium]|uniref:Uncharacterized protein n=1 Tax=Sesamum latifolium TaxID=2727402 RepID=A0AAW2TM62_9LAMI